MNHRRLWLGVSLAVSLLFSCWSRSMAAAPELPRSVQSAIVAAVEHDRKIYGGKTPVPGVLIGVWDGSGRSFIRSFGYANLATRSPMMPADHFRIGSNTKTFVVSVLLQLVDEGKLRLDDPLSRFSLGVTIPNARNITVREVARMRSGLFEAFDTPEFNHANVTPNSKWDPHTLIRGRCARSRTFRRTKATAIATPTI